MNLPRTEFYPDDPERLPPARRRRVRRLLTPLDADERSAFLDQMAYRASPSFDFFLFSLLAGAMIGVGLLLDSPALLVLGALAAPLMAPVVGIALGTIIGSIRYFVRSAIGLLIGSGLVFVSGLAVGYIAAQGRSLQPWETTLAYAYVHVNWPNFVLLGFGAIFTAVKLTHPERRAAVSSVALAYVLYIPLTIAGFGLGSEMPRLWPDGLITFVIYLSWSALLGAISLAVLGFRPLTLFGYTLGATVTLIGIILLVGLSSAAVEVQVTRPTATATLTRTPTPIPPTATHTPTPVPPTLTLTPTITPTRTPTLTPTVSPTPTPVYARVNATSGGGAFLRAEAGFDGRGITTLTNGTLVIVLPDTVEINGFVWVHIIVAPDGPEGWILMTLLEAATPQPNW